jgi:hypothetical protein
MPLEIKELVIRATVDAGGGDEGATDKGKPADRESLVAECVEQVMQILRRERER